MAAPSHYLKAGTLLGRYEILAPIATGGMARVWAARLRGSRGFAKTVAIKTLLPTVSDDERFERMFLDEARIASRIRHGNVVSILDLGEDEQRQLLYLVMEYVDGESLATLRRAAADADGIPLRLGLKIIADTAAGLHACHQLRGDDGNLVGLVHRDVSPQNVLISYDGSVKVTDFGVAKAAGRVSQSTGRTLKGKPAFMSPEQIEGMNVDARADVFGLGIVLYQLVCGQHPFRGENELITIKNILSKRPVQRPSAVNPAIDAKLEAVILRALERDPNLRFQSAAELEYALDDLMRTGRRPRDDELAVLIDRLLGQAGRERRAAIERAAAAADRRAADAERSSQNPSEPSGDRRSPLVRPSGAPSRTSAVPSSAPSGSSAVPSSAPSGSSAVPSGLPSGIPSGGETALAYAGSSLSAADKRSNAAVILVITAGMLALLIVAAGAIWLFVHGPNSRAERDIDRALPAKRALAGAAAEGTSSEPIVAPGTSMDTAASTGTGAGTNATTKRRSARAHASPSAALPSASAPVRLKPPVPVMDPGF